jgi:hypothetical protein
MYDYTAQLPWETPEEAKQRLQDVADEEARIQAIQELIDEEETLATA